MITFNDLLTDPKYREMDFRILNEVHIDSNLSVKEYNKGLRYFKKTTNLGKHLFNHLQKLKAESEKKAEPEYQTIYDNPATPYARMVNGKIVCITKEELEIMESGVDKHFFAHGLTETSIENKQAVYPNNRPKSPRDLRQVF